MHKKKVEISLHAPDAISVAVLGTFNNWNARLTPMRKDHRGLWRAQVPVREGQHIYWFVVDGQPLNEIRTSKLTSGPLMSSSTKPSSLR